MKNEKVRQKRSILQTLPPDNKEKKLLDWFLTGKTRLLEETQKTLTQRRLFQMDKILNKTEYYLTRCNEMEQKYGKPFAAFKTQVSQ